MTYGGSRRPDLAARLRRSQRALKGRLERPETVLALLRAAHDTLEPETIGGLVIDCADEWFKASACGVFAIDIDGQVVGLASRGLSAASMPGALSLARWVLVHGREFATADLRKDPRVTGASGAAFGLPLRCRSETVAALVVAERRASSLAPRFAPAVTELLRAILEGPAQSLDNALRLRRVEALSVTDDLTQLYNSRYLNQVLRREAKRASRSGRPLSLLFMDLDGFKGINDSHGHQAGSRALVEAAAVIRRCARETDVVARFGGDEFAVILPDTGSEGAAAVGDRVRERMAAHPFLAADGLTIRLTASVGVATLPDVAASAEELVRAADMAMYQVKESGKNGVRIAQTEGLG
ncbi:MAG: GGDEF domain-containing protein [Vicinamibacterales bacterium]